MPKGGGAIRGIGENFAVNRATGTASLSIPLPVSPARGLTPDLALTYDSGAGNGPAGLGWRLGTAAISRKTDTGLPTYDDSRDTFLLAGAEELVLRRDPVTGDPSEPIATSQIGAEPYRVEEFRPRVEGLFARVERWTREHDADVHWRTISRDNVTSLYGRTAEARIARGTRVFSWLLCERWDDRGNAVHYVYKAEDLAGVDRAQAHEVHRELADVAAQRYLKRISYCNRTPSRPGDDLSKRGDWLMELVLDYGDHDPVAPPMPGEDRSWLVRADAFSNYRAGFELRTYRLCRRVLMFHHFPEPGVGANTLVKSAELAYDETPVASYLARVVHAGHVRRPGGYRHAAMPAMSLRYARPELDPAIRTVDAAALADLGGAPDPANWRWEDLEGDGAPGLVSDDGTAWRFKANRSPATHTLTGEKADAYVRLAGVRTLATRPAVSAWEDGGQQLVQAVGDARPDVVVVDGPLAGIQARANGGWAPHVPFSGPAAGVDERRVFVDLTGDGQTDLLIASGQRCEWLPWLGPAGWGAPRPVRPAEPQGAPLNLLTGEAGAFRVADMTGDGLPDVVEVRRDRVGYWPNLGYGAFGGRVTMSDAPVLDSVEAFDSARVRLVDTDGCGPADLLYVGASGLRIYANQSGNGFALTQVISAVPEIDDPAAVAVIDLLGTGTACLVWGAATPGRPLRYVDLLGARKPHLLIEVDNNLGASTQLEYAASTKFAAGDALAGRPWVTELPFPVQVVERVVVRDVFSRSVFVTRYAYHHGHYDPREREFRGFGMVEQWDTEDLGALRARAGMPDPGNLDESFSAQPVRTRCWLHTGASDPAVVDAYARAYWPPPAATARGPGFLELRSTSLPPGLTATEERDGYRALKGRVMREEVCALNGGTTAEVPYSVTEHSYGLRRLQPARDGQSAVFLVHPAELLEHRFEGHVAQPRTRHELTLAVSDWGDVERSAQVAYGRTAVTSDSGFTDADHARQRALHVRYVSAEQTAALETADAHRGPLPWKSRGHEVIGLVPEPERRLTPRDFDAVAGWPEIGPEAPLPAAGRARRLVEGARHRYLADDLSGPLAWGAHGALGLRFESYQLALTPDILAAFAPRVPAAELAGLLSNASGYVDLDGDGHWWLPAGRQFHGPIPEPPPAGHIDDVAHARAHFFLVRATRDSFGALTRTDFDGYDLLPAHSTDARGNVRTVWATDAAGQRFRALDYRVLAPYQVTEPNGNRTRMAFDALGEVAASAVMGKETEAIGDRITGLRADLDQADLNAFYDDPLGAAAGLLAGATTRSVRDITRYERLRDPDKPPWHATVLRETHASDVAPGQTARVHASIAYSDGFARGIQAKHPAEPGPGGAARWAATGWAIFDAKGRTVRTYEPFFSPTHEFQFAVLAGLPGTTLLSDPLGRVIATLHADHTYEKLVVNAWGQEEWDVNDNVLRADPRTDPDVGARLARLPSGDLLPTWHNRRGASADPAERAAAQATTPHDSSPTALHLDALGRTFLTFQHNGRDAQGAPIRFATRFHHDSAGRLRSTVDAKGQTVATAVFDLLGRRVRASSLDAGTRWTLTDAGGGLLCRWDDRAHRERTAYDALRRPVRRFVRYEAEPGAPEEIVARTEYGEDTAAPEAANRRGKIFRQWDASGLATHVRYDFKGTLVESERRLVANPHLRVDWANPPALEGRAFTAKTTFDALERPVRTEHPDGSTIESTYNVAMLVEHVEATIPGSPGPRTILDAAEYDAQGRRERLVLGNGAIRTFGYDDETKRLARIRTLLGAEVLQDLRYGYDPAGNVTSVSDDALTEVFFRNRRVSPDRTFRYDPLYRLVYATGREHLGQLGGAPRPPAPGDPFHAHREHPRDGEALGGYEESYGYDALGNLTELHHRGLDPQHAGWKRTYAYAGAGNRLSATTQGADTVPYRHDPHGNLSFLAHLDPTAQQNLHWDADERLVRADLGGGGTARYAYDGAGGRVRKLRVRTNGTVQEERVYIGDWELYRRFTGAGAVELARTTLHASGEEGALALIEHRTEGDDGSPALLTRFQIADRAGSATLELNELARVISYEELFPYGATAYHAQDPLIRATAKRYRNTGKERDTETGLDYHGARYYAPWLGRWTACDPAGGLNPYLYVLGNPVRLTDPDGSAERDGGAQSPEAKVGPIDYFLIRWEAHRKYGQSVFDAVDHDRSARREAYIREREAEVSARSASEGNSFIHYDNRARERAGEAAAAIGAAAEWTKDNVPGVKPAVEAVDEAIDVQTQAFDRAAGETFYGMSGNEQRPAVVANDQRAEVRHRAMAIAGPGIRAGAGAATNAVGMAKATASLAQTAIVVTRATRKAIRYVAVLQASKQIARKLDNVLHAGGHFVYVLRGRDGSVLYVGISNNPWRRLGEHMADKSWAPEVRKIDLVSGNLSPAEALAKETDLIRSLDPEYNEVRDTLYGEFGIPHDIHVPVPTSNIGVTLDVHWDPK